MPLNVYKASAGSGKTYQLAKEYIKILIKNPYLYRNILAVTFTNKATEEMKERIMNKLYALSLGQCEMMAIISQEIDIKYLKTKIDSGDKHIQTNDDDEYKKERIKQRADKALQLIIHDYGHFNIQTIDRFFQSILKYMAKELGLSSRYNIELDNKKVLADAIKRIITDCDQKEDLRDWINSYIRESIDGGKSWNIEKGLNDFGENIFKELFKENEDRFIKVLGQNKDLIKNFKKEIRKKKKDLELKLKNLYKSFDDLLTKNNLSVNDCNWNTKGPASYFLNLQNGTYTSDLYNKSRLQQALNNPAKVWGKKIPENIAIKLSELIEETETKRKKLAPQYYSLELIEKNINQIGLMMDISEKVKTINTEKGQFLLSDTGPLLSKMLNDSDASFIFEKAGTEFNYILFDEFQDTSTMQWKTFKPLIKESLSNGYSSLIVGDEKQAIYRWRNGSWEILGNIKQEIKSPKPIILDYNYRSEDTIVNFNNDVFEKVKKTINNNNLNTVYSAIGQKSIKQNGGYIECNFITKQKNDTKKRNTEEEESINLELVKEKLFNKVKELQDKGIAARDISILIRKNKDIAPIADYFAEQAKKPENQQGSNCYDIISDDAFLLSSSAAIRTIILALRSIINPEDKILKAALCTAYQRVEEIKIKNKENIKNKKNFKNQYTEELDKFLPEEFDCNALIKLPLLEIVEKLYRIFKLDILDGQDGFMFCFMDGIKDYINRNTADINDFLGYYDETLSQKSIPAGAGIDGIRILTIHKSKGLEFNTVIIPTCDWNIAKPISGSLIWCKPKKDIIDTDLPILPIPMQNLTREDSKFVDEYNDEITQMTIDNINLLYVAFTRASKNLITFSQIPIEKDSNEKKSNETSLSTTDDWTKKNVGELLQNTFNQTDSTKFKKIEDPNNHNITTFSIGEIEGINTQVTSKEKVKKQNKDPELMSKGEDLKDVKFLSFEEKTIFRQSNEAIEFSGESTSTKYIERGKLMHYLFSKIKTISDIPQKVNELLSKGLIISDEKQDLITKTENAIKGSKVEDWFSGKYILYNECAILCKNESGEITTRRPDRVMIDNNKTIIVDFKFGKQNLKYHKQILEYKNLMARMNYENITCYLWYVDDNKVEEVK